MVLGSLLYILQNNMFLCKASMVNIPYDPVLHDLSITPRNMTAMEIVEFWLGNILPNFHICQMYLLLQKHYKHLMLLTGMIDLIKLIYQASSSHLLVFLVIFYYWRLDTTIHWQLEHHLWVWVYNMI